MFSSPSSVSIVGMLIPIVAMLIPIVAIIAGAWTQVQSARLKADQRMAMLARGISVAEIEAVLRSATDSEPLTAAKDPMSLLGRARRAAVVLISTGLGLITFFCLVGAIFQARPAFAFSAAGIIPLAIGIGFVIDYQLQKRELARFGVDLDANSR